MEEKTDKFIKKLEIVQKVCFSLMVISWVVCIISAFCEWHKLYLVSYVVALGFIGIQMIIHFYISGIYRGRLDILDSEIKRIEKEWEEKKKCLEKN